MKHISEKEIYNKGLDWLEINVNSFYIESNHYFTPSVVDLLISLNKYHYEALYLGSSDHGVCKHTFKLKTEEELLKEQQDKDLNYQISLIEKKFNVKLKIQD